MNEVVNIAGAELTTRQTVSADLFQRWIAYIDASPKTVATYTRAIKRFFLYLQSVGISQPTRETVVQYREYLKQDHKPTTVQSYLTAVKLFFQWTDQECLYPDIANHVKGAKLDAGHKRDYLTSKQAARLLEGVDRSSLKGLRDYAILSLMVTTGLRTVSVIRANIQDIRIVGDDVALFYQGKGHEEKATFVKLAPPVDEAIRAYLKARGSADKTAPLFASIAHRNRGQRMTTRSISRLAKEHLVSVGLDSDRLTAHSLRHTAATLNLLNGGTIEETKQLLDHASINTTLIYSHALERSKNKSEIRIAKAVFG